MRVDGCLHPTQNLTVLHPTTMQTLLGDYANIRINTEKTNKNVIGHTKTKCWQNWLAGCSLWAPTYGY